MTSCWKCGREIEDGQVECQLCAAGVQGVEPEDLEQLRKEWHARSAEIDWDRVKTLDDLKAIVQVLISRIELGTEVYWNLKRFLKD